MRTRITIILLSVLMAGCSATPKSSLFQHAPELGATTRVQRTLNDLPAPKQRISVAVYGFADQTGQFKPSDGGQSLSRAVSQGGTSILVKAMQDAGRGSWFSVVEREHLDNLLKERQIIREMRAKYLGEEGINPAVLPPMFYAGVIFEGGIIGFDSNTITGGAGARFLGIGASTKYKQDTVSVYLRAVSTKTGEVLASVVVRKSIASIAVQGDAFRFVDFKQLFEAELGQTVNEPAEFALQQAIQKAVIALVLEGNEKGLWDFARPSEGAGWLDEYDREKRADRRAISTWVAEPEPAPIVSVAKPRAATPVSGDPEPAGTAPSAKAFDPAAAATNGGSSGIAQSATSSSPAPKRDEPAVPPPSH